MKVAVYNRYWRTLGGGEKYSGMVAQCLSGTHEVDLLVHEPLDRALIKERLDLDLQEVGIRMIPKNDSVAFAYQSAKYDLLVNSTFGSTAPCSARYGLYICYFPVPYAPISTGLTALVHKVLSDRKPLQHIHIEWGDGWFGHERGRHVYRWSTEQPTLRVWTPRGVETQVRLIFLRLLPKRADPTELMISIDGKTVRTLRIEPGRGEVAVTLPLLGDGLHPTVLQLNCNTFRPHEQFGSDDPRHLGVALVADQSGNPANGFTYSRRCHMSTPQLHFLDSYDEIVSISAYTQRWMTKLWNKQSQVIAPPVSQYPRAGKEPVILSVGRFFDHSGAHGKKQAEMVCAFRELVDRGLKGWTYHLVGGCESAHLPYLQRVRELGEGLPVEIHVDASGALLRDLYSRASIFWHATGLGEHERQFPERSEHFGITTVEAMSAGAVPVVIGKAGQLETLVDRVHGRHFTSSDELVRITWELAHDEPLRRRYSLAAEERARDFGPEAFDKRLNSVIAEIVDR